eukprot:TRINITY_DN3235_c0_g1_i1.p1 TRINITY_DN3235_c0_g1~~TRINITY_DN3235_c0_g1_i1.p1  ORF type:complete len:1714 (-),score=501.51 TRINITY_DN3235_c0_g1_i1:139-5280(-)
MPPKESDDKAQAAKSVDSQGSDVQAGRQPNGLDEAIARKIGERLRMATSKGGKWHPKTAKKLFLTFDEDKSGNLDFEEMRVMVRKKLRVVEKDISDEDIRALMNAIDDDGSGEVSIDEIVDFLEEELQKQQKERDEEVDYASLRKKAGQKLDKKIRKKKKEPVKLDPAIEKNLRFRLRYATSRNGRWNEALARKVIGEFDKDRGGDLGIEEFTKLVRLELKIPKNQLSDQDIKLFFRAVDQDGEGSIDIEELIEFMQVEEDEKEKKGKAPVMTLVQELEKQKGDQMDAVLERARERLRFATSKDGRWSSEHCEKLLRTYDVDGGGMLDQEEFRKLFRMKLRITAKEVTDENIRRLFDCVDEDKGGEVSIEELVTFIEKQDDSDEAKQRREATEKSHARAQAALSKLSKGGRNTTVLPEVDPDRKYGRMPEKLETSMRERLRFATQKNGEWSENLTRRLLEDYDKDRSGELDEEEFNRLVRVRLRIPKELVADADVELFFMAMDQDGGGSLGIEELVEFIKYEPEKKIDTDACQRCGFDLPPDAQFCRKCGLRRAKEEKEETRMIVKRCPTCTNAMRWTDKAQKREKAQELKAREAAKQKRNEEIERNKQIYDRLLFAIERYMDQQSLRADTLFHILDKEKTGNRLEKRELTNFLINQFPCKRADAEKVFRHLDGDGSGYISFDEWMAHINKKDFNKRAPICNQCENVYMDDETEFCRRCGAKRPDKAEMLMHASQKHVESLKNRAQESIDAEKEVCTKMKKALFEYVEKQKLQKGMFRVSDFFREVDSNMTGTVDQYELTHFVTTRLGLDLAESEVMWRSIDTDADGAVDFNEWTEAMQKDFDKWARDKLSGNWQQELQAWKCARKFGRRHNRKLCEHDSTMCGNWRWHCFTCDKDYCRDCSDFFEEVEDGPALHVAGDEVTPTPADFVSRGFGGERSGRSAANFPEPTSTRIFDRCEQEPVRVAPGHPLLPGNRKRVFQRLFEEYESKVNTWKQIRDDKLRQEEEAEISLLQAHVIRGDEEDAKKNFERLFTHAAKKAMNMDKERKKKDAEIDRYASEMAGLTVPPKERKARAKEAAQRNFEAQYSRMDWKTEQQQKRMQKELQYMAANSVHAHVNQSEEFPSKTLEDTCDRLHLEHQVRTKRLQTMMDKDKKRWDEENTRKSVHREQPKTASTWQGCVSRLYGTWREKNIIMKHINQKAKSRNERRKAGVNSERFNLLYFDAFRRDEDRRQISEPAETTTPRKELSEPAAQTRFNLLYFDAFRRDEDRRLISEPQRRKAQPAPAAKTRFNLLYFDAFRRADDRRLDIERAEAIRLRKAQLVSVHSAAQMRPWSKDEQKEVFERMHSRRRGSSSFKKALDQDTQAVTNYKQAMSGDVRLGSGVDSTGIGESDGEGYESQATTPRTLQDSRSRSVPAFAGDGGGSSSARSVNMWSSTLSETTSAARRAIQDISNTLRAPMKAWGANKSEQELNTSTSTLAPEATANQENLESTYDFEPSVEETMRPTLAKTFDVETGSEDEASVSEGEMSEPQMSPVEVKKLVEAVKLRVAGRGPNRPSIATPQAPARRLSAAVEFPQPSKGALPLRLQENMDRLSQPKTGDTPSSRRTSAQQPVPRGSNRSQRGSDRGSHRGSQRGSARPSPRPSANTPRGGSGSRPTLKIPDASGGADSRRVSGQATPRSRSKRSELAPQAGPANKSADQRGSRASAASKA